jgi:hypothetical protein
MSFRFRITRLALASLTLPAALAARQAPAIVQLQRGPVAITATSTQQFLQALHDTSLGALHGVALLRRHPSAAQRQMLADRGLTVLSAIRDGFYRVRVLRQISSSDSVIGQWLQGLTLLQPQDRVSPLLAQSGDSLILVAVGFQAGLPATEELQVLGRLSTEARRLGDGYWRTRLTPAGIRTLSGSDLVRWIGTGSQPFLVDNDNTRAATGVDLVQDFSLGLGLPQRLGGKGVQVGMFDLGIDENHDDFKIFTTGFSTVNRVVLSRTEKSWHGTLTAGIVAASGHKSNGTDSRGVSNGNTPYRWRGMAPQAELLEFLPFDGSSELSVSNDDFYDLIVNKGQDISNHPYGLDTDASGKPTGDYGFTSANVDGLIRGDGVATSGVVPPRLQVYSAGNFGGSDGTNPVSGASSAQYGFFSLNKEIKNGLLVGNWRVSEGRLVGSSSLGPTWDGRIKPDVVAPGSHVKSTGYWPANTAIPSNNLCTQLPSGTASSSTDRSQFYGVDCGTSLAAPVVTGILALVLQQYALSFGVDLDAKPPLPSTLRALIIHSADDVSNGTTWFSNPDAPVQALHGPDFATGFGLVNAQAAVGLVEDMLIREGTIEEDCSKVTYTINVGAVTDVNPPPVRVTLAWDDFPAEAFAADRTLPRLQNDLDLVLIDPMGVRHYPWQLNQVIKAGDGTHVLTPEEQTCGTPIKVETQLHPPGPLASSDFIEATTGPDHLNNVELVEAPRLAGTWKVEVSGFRVVAGPQSYSIIGVLPAFVTWRPVPVCVRYPGLCVVWATTICQRIPDLCHREREIPLGPIGPIIRFQRGQDAVVLPLRQVCALRRVPGRCVATSPGYELRLGPAPVGVALYSSTGVLVAQRSSLPQRSVLRFHPRRGEEFFLVVTPAPQAGIVPAPVTLPVRIRPVP